MKPKDVRDIDFVMICRLIAVCDDFDSAYGGGAAMGGQQFDDIARRVNQILMEVRSRHAIVDPNEVPGGVDGSDDALLAADARRGEELETMRSRGEI